MMGTYTRSVTTETTTHQSTLSDTVFRIFNFSTHKMIRIVAMSNFLGELEYSNNKHLSSQMSVSPETFVTCGLQDYP